MGDEPTRALRGAAQRRGGRPVTLPLQRADSGLAPLLSVSTPVRITTFTLLTRRAATVAGSFVLAIQSACDGSQGTVHYFANGNKSFPKERLEVFAGGRILQLDNYRRLTGYGWPGFKKMSLWRQDKGQKACAAAFLRAISEGGAAPIAFEEIVESSRISLEVAESLRG